MRYLYRLKQFYTYFSSELNEHDYDFLSKYLTKEQKKFLMRLPKYEIKHSLDVAYYIKKRLGNTSSDMITAGLMHDIGKIGVKSPVQKAFAASLYLLMPHLTEILSAKIKFINIYLHHAAIGAEKAKKLGLNGHIVYLIYHHNDKEPSDEEVALLQEADSYN